MEQKNEIEQKLNHLLFASTRIFTVGDEYNSDAAINTEDARNYAKNAFNLGLEVAADYAEADYNFINGKYEEIPDIEVYVIKNSILQHKLK